MTSYENKKCPRCSLSFECNPGNITQCQCYGVVFSEADREHIRDSYDDCLCRNCLDEIAAGQTVTLSKVG